MAAALVECNLLVAALAECMRSAAAALAVPSKLAVSKDSTTAAVASRDLSVVVTVGMGLSVAVASTATSAGRSPAEASTAVAFAMHCTPGRIGSCSRGCKQLVWERSSESAA